MRKLLLTKNRLKLILLAVGFITVVPVMISEDFDTDMGGRGILFMAKCI